MKYLIATLGICCQATFAQITSEFRENKLTSCQEVYLDDDGHPYKKQWLSNEKLDSTIFFNSNGTEFKGDLAITDTPHFENGFKALTKFVKDNYVSRPGSETNGKAIVMFVFSEDTIDMRIIDRVGYSLRYYNYDVELIRVLNLVKKKWSVRHMKSKLPIVFFYPFEIS